MIPACHLLVENLVTRCIVSTVYRFHGTGRRRLIREAELGYLRTLPPLHKQQAILPSGKIAHHPGWKPLQVGFSPPRPQQDPLPSARKGVRGKVCGAVPESERLGVSS